MIFSLYNIAYKIKLWKKEKQIQYSKFEYTQQMLLKNVISIVEKYCLKGFTGY